MHSFDKTAWQNKTAQWGRMISNWWNIPAFLAAYVDHYTVKRVTKMPQNLERTIFYRLGGPMKNSGGGKNDFLNFGPVPPSLDKKCQVPQH